MTGEEVLKLLQSKRPTGYKLFGYYRSPEDELPGEEEIWNKVKDYITKCFYLDYEVRDGFNLISKSNLIYGEYYNSEITGIYYKRGRKTIDVLIRFCPAVSNLDADCRWYHSSRPLRIADIMEDQEERRVRLKKQYYNAKLSKITEKIDRCMVNLGKLLEEKEKLEEGN